jgi:hypothetical protein
MKITRNYAIWLFKTTISLFVFAFCAALGGFFYLGLNDQPESFQEGTKMPLKNKNVLDKIGTYRSHSWKERDMPTDNDNPARFKVAIQGTDAKIYLTCIVETRSKGVWRLVKINQDSISIITAPN